VLLEGHFQNGYVTADLDRAVEQLRTQWGIDDVTRFEVAVDVRTVRGFGPGVCKVAFKWLGNLQFEVLQPVSGLDGIYDDALRSGQSIVFHHICMRVFDWDRLHAELDRQKLPIVLEGARGDGLRVLYADARDRLGHYLEYVWMSPEVWTASGGR
jgi:hypothetical protein